MLLAKLYFLGDFDFLNVAFWAEIVLLFHAEVVLLVHAEPQREQRRKGFNTLLYSPIQGWLLTDDR